MVNDARRPAVVGRRNGYPDRYLLLLRMGRTRKNGSQRDKCHADEFSTHSLFPPKTGAFLLFKPRMPQIARPDVSSIVRLSAAERTLHQHGDDDDRALNGTDQIFADEVRQDHDVAHDFQNEGAANRTPDAAHTTP